MRPLPKLPTNLSDRLVKWRETGGQSPSSVRRLGDSSQFETEPSGVFLVTLVPFCEHLNRRFYGRALAGERRDWRGLQAAYRRKAASELGGSGLLNVGHRAEQMS
jgi:hypothetical protein